MGTWKTVDWTGYGPCRCGASDGEPCRGLRGDYAATTRPHRGRARFPRSEHSAPRRAAPRSSNIIPGQTGAAKLTPRVGAEGEAGATGVRLTAAPRGWWWHRRSDGYSEVSRSRPDDPTGWTYVPPDGEEPICDDPTCRCREGQAGFDAMRRAWAPRLRELANGGRGPVRVGNVVDKLFQDWQAPSDNGHTNGTRR